jgi:hypothetical protein
MKLRRQNLGLLSLAILASATLAGSSVIAQPAARPAGAAQPTAPTDDSQQGPKVKVEKGAGGKTVYRITEAIRIEGKIQKPEAFYVLQKSSINYDWQDLKQDFVPKIVDSVSRAPF